jgi:hypothetical protein
MITFQDYGIPLLIFLIIVAIPIMIFLASRCRGRQRLAILALGPIIITLGIILLIYIMSNATGYAAFAFIGYFILFWIALGLFVYYIVLLLYYLRTAKKSVTPSRKI